MLGRLEPHKQGSGKRRCCALEMVLALGQERCGMDQQLLLGSGLQVQHKRAFHWAALVIEMLNGISPLGLLLEPKPALSEKPGADESAKSGLRS